MFNGKEQINFKWPLIKLDAVLTHYKEYIEAPEPRIYPKLSVKLYGRGVVLDTPADGTMLKMKRHQIAKAGQVILSEIWGKKGAIGFVPEGGEGALCTSHFFLFDIKEGLILRGWLEAIFKANYLEEQLGAEAFGTTGYAAVRPKDLLAATIPLPPLSEQRRIVAKIEQLAAKIEEARGLREAVTVETFAFLKSARRAAIGDKPDDSWFELQDVISDIENGASPECKKHPASNGKWGVVKVGAVSFGEFDPSQNKELPDTLKPEPEYEIKPGDFLMSRANTLELVGACALVKQTPRRLLLSDKIFRFIFHNENKLESTYLNHVLKSPALRQQIEEGATGTSPTMKNIAKAKIMRLCIPLPPLDEQRRIVAYLDSLQAQVDRLKALQAQTAAELEALLPSILDRAFKGEL